MGYVHKRTYRLRFEDDLDGLVVRMRGLSVDGLLELTELANQAGPDGKGLDMSKVGRLFDAFADGLVEWNLEEEDGTAVPATREGVGQQEFGLVFKLVTEWMTAAAGVSAPLDTSSTSGASSVEASLPMELLSASPSS